MFLGFFPSYMTDYWTFTLSTWFCEYQESWCHAFLPLFVIIRGKPGFLKLSFIKNILISKFSYLIVFLRGSLYMGMNIFIKIIVFLSFFLTFNSSFHWIYSLDNPCLISFIYTMLGLNLILLELLSKFILYFLTYRSNHVLSLTFSRNVLEKKDVTVVALGTFVKTNKLMKIAYAIFITGILIGLSNTIFPWMFLSSKD